MTRRRKEQDDVTPELTGNDASFSEVPYGEPGRVSLETPDTVDDGDPGLRLEADPSRTPDILPDKVELADGSPPTDDEEPDWTARPNEELRPIPVEELPSHDPEAAEEDDDAHTDAALHAP